MHFRVANIARVRSHRRFPSRRRGYRRRMCRHPQALGLSNRPAGYLVKTAGHSNLYQVAPTAVDFESHRRTVCCILSSLTGFER